MCQLVVMPRDEIQLVFFTNILPVDTKPWLKMLDVLLGEILLCKRTMVSETLQPKEFHQRCIEFTSFAYEYKMTKVELKENNTDVKQRKNQILVLCIFLSSLCSSSLTMTHPNQSLILYSWRPQSWSWKFHGPSGQDCKSNSFS